MNVVQRMVLWALPVVAACSACGESEMLLSSFRPPVAEPTTLDIHPTSVTLRRPGSIDTLTVTIRDQDGNRLSGVALDWESSDPTVALVSTSGVVEAVGSGNAVVSASVRSRPAVSGRVPVESFSPRVPSLLIANDGLDTVWINDVRRPRDWTRFLVPVVVLSQYGDSISAVPTVTSMIDGVDDIVFDVRSGGVLFESISGGFEESPVVENFIIRAGDAAVTITAIVRKTYFEFDGVHALQLVSGQTWNDDIYDWFNESFIEYDIFLRKPATAWPIDPNSDAVTISISDGVLTVVGVESGAITIRVVASNSVEQAISQFDVLVDYCYEPETARE